MRVLVIGGGGREHALTWKIAQSDRVSEVICAPGNAGMAAEPKTSCVPIGAEDLAGLVRLAKERRVDLVVVGPEMPLCEGLADQLTQAGVATMGPCRQASQLEGSKVFAKELMRRQGVPTADFHVFDDAQKALAFVRENPGPWVVKADGLAAGKGVYPCSKPAEAEQAIRTVMVDRAFGAAGDRVIVEAFLEGEEASCIALVAGDEILMLASSQDHKRALDGDEGPNTGGMGAYSPAPVMNASLEQEVIERVFKPVVAGLKADGIDYRGVLYAGLMIGAAGLQVLEFNVRFGDPETQALIPRIASDLVPALAAVAHGELAGVKLEWDQRPAVCVVMSAGGYPGSYEKGKIISGLEAASALQDVVVIHAGTKLERGAVQTAGGRVLAVCALGADIRSAVERAYAGVDEIDFEDVHYRKDIAHRALARL